MSDSPIDNWALETANRQLRAELEAVRAELAAVDTTSEGYERRVEWKLLCARAEKAEAERDAYKKAKAENDERFMLEWDATRAERDQARAELQAERLAHMSTLGQCEEHIPVSEAHALERERDDARKQHATLVAAACELVTEIRASWIASTKRVSNAVDALEKLLP